MTDWRTAHRIRPRDLSYVRYSADSLQSLTRLLYCEEKVTLKIGTELYVVVGHGHTVCLARYILINL